MLEAGARRGRDERGRRGAARRRPADAAAPLLLHRYGFDVAAVISASHNPYRDNGIKFFGADGHKLPDDGRAGDRAAPRGPAGAVPERIGSVRVLRGTHEDYLRELLVRFDGLDLSGLDVLLDCANGATYKAAPEVFRRLGAAATVVAAEPDGRNINEGCGSTHVEALAERVVEGGHAVGFAFDGDGDRVLAVDRTGAVVDGDELVALAALHLRDTDRLRGGVVVTVMTNYGFHTGMAAHDIEVATTKVGDRYVLEELRARDWDLGGEQSGPHHRPVVQPDGRRDRVGAPGPRGARRSRPGRSGTSWTSCPSGSSTCAWPTATG
jgi:phosphoglucosamine mutase